MSSRMLALFLIVLLTGIVARDAGADPTDVRPGAMLVKDSVGTVVGTYLGEADPSERSAAVVRMVGATAVWFVTTPVLDNPDGTIVFFESTDCTGTGYVDVQRNKTFAAYGQIIGAGPRLYYATGPAGPPITHNAQLVSMDNATCAIEPGGVVIPPTGCCYLATDTRPNLAPAAYEDMSGFVPPLHVGP